MSSGPDQSVRKCTAVDKDVGRDHHGGVVDGDHGRVVTGGDHHVRTLRQPADQGVDQAELPAVGDRLVAGHRRAQGVALGALHPVRSGPADGRRVMVTAYILIQTEVGRAAEVADQIAKISGVTLAENLIGAYDVIVRAEANSDDELGRFVVAQVQAVPGITRTLTCPVINL